MTQSQPEALRLAHKYDVVGFVGEHRFAQDKWCRDAAAELRRQHARIEELEAQLSAIGVEPLRKQAPVVPQGWKLTEEMHVAAVKVLHRASGVDDLPQRMVDAMLAAAPQPPAAAPAQEGWCDGCSPDNCCGCGPGAAQAKQGEKE